MVVRDWMTPDVVTVRKTLSVQEALAVVKRHSIRHLPVVDEERRLLGWATDSDLRGALIASMLEDLTLEDIMVREPYATRPDAPLEECARLMVSRRIGGLPVVEEGRLRGVITVVDVLSAYLALTGVIEDSSRLDVHVPLTKKTTTVERMAKVIAEGGGHIVSICYLPSSTEERPLYSVRLRKCDTAAIAESLEKKGFEVIRAA